MNPDASMKTRKQAFIVSKIHWWRHQVSQVRAVEIIDLRISYQKGEPIAYIRPITTHCQLVVNPKQVLPCTIIAVEPQALRDLETREDGSFDSLVALFRSLACAPVLSTGLVKMSLASFRKKKNPEMSPTMAQHFRYTRCDPPPERFAVGVPFAFATSCFRQGHRRYAQRTWRRETHRD